MNRTRLHHIVFHPLVGLVVRLILGCIFIYASFDKIQNPASFAEIIYNYRILPAWTINVLAITLPWLEIIIGCFLILGIARTGSSFLLSGILVVFIIALALAILRGLDINCGCFSISASGDKVAISRLLEDVVLLGLSLYLLLAPFSVWQWSFAGIKIPKSELKYLK